MAERKKRGLGRGLGALIPDAASNDRPVDVFFSGSSAEEGARTGEETKSPRTRRTDPAASMQSSRRRKPKAADAEESVTKPAKTAGAKATSTKSGGTGAKSAGSKSAGEPATARKSTRGTKASPDASKPVDTPVVADVVLEQSPGVFTSKGDEAGSTAEGRDKKQKEHADTTNIVDSTGEGPGADSSEVSDDADGVDSIPDTAYGEIDVARVDPNPRQPRTVFDEDQLAELVHSIREIGVLQPVVVRRKPGEAERYELIMGERRLRATKEAGLETIPAIVRYVENTDLLRDALLENLHRADLNPLEEAAAYGQLLEDFGCTQEELSDRIGRSRPQISNTLRLLRLPPLVQRRVAAGVISAGHARAILGLKDPEQMEVLAQRIVAEGLSVRASEEAVVLLNRGDSVNVSRATSRVAPEFIEVAERLGDRLDTKVNITVGERKGKLSVEFANQEDLDRILALLGVKSGE